MLKWLLKMCLMCSGRHMVYINDRSYAVSLYELGELKRRIVPRSFWELGDRVSVKGEDSFRIFWSS